VNIEDGDFEIITKCTVNIEFMKGMLRSCEFTFDEAMELIRVIIERIRR
jgi:hypothetical protein